MQQGPDGDVCGFMPDDEGSALYELATIGATVGPLLEIGSYCGRSTIWLGQAAKAQGTVVFAVDHHRGSEEHQPGEAFHDPSLVNTEGLFDTLPAFRRNIARYQLEDTVIPIVFPAAALADHWTTPLGLLFIDGGHSLAAALADYRGWVHHLKKDGILVIHDVFPNARDGGQAPCAIWQLARASGLFEEIRHVGSLRALQRR
jgi:predicted O-methyltransferase YrrM